MNASRVGPHHTAIGMAGLNAFADSAAFIAIAAVPAGLVDFADMISIIIPAFNEGNSIGPLYQRLMSCAETWNEDYEIVFVDDGSTDNTLTVMAELAWSDPRIRVVALSRNFGHQPAVTAGLENCRGDLIAVLDADLQDPPEELQRFFHKCREGYDVVYAVRTKRKEGFCKRVCYKLYYRLLASLANIAIPLDAGDFCVMTRRALDALNALPERGRFVRGLRSWIGFRQLGLEYERQARVADAPKYTFTKLVQLALDGIINFSSKPLRLIMVAGAFLALFSLVAAVLVLVQYVFDITLWIYNPRHQPGWTSLMLAILFLSSAQLFCLGIIGEYVGRLFEEVKRRPAYMVGRTINMDTGRDASRSSKPHFGKRAAERAKKLIVVDDSPHGH
jgi:polyisoprenyl-phosphate glycosyltransferase